MGQLTRTQIITQGLQLAGRTDLTTRAIEALRNWLRAQYKAQPAFTFLRESREGLALPAGTTSLKIGVGEGGIAGEVQRVLRPVRIYTSSYSVDATAGILSRDDQTVENDIRTKDSTKGRGLPTSFKVVKARITGDTKLCKALVPNIVPDKAYLLTFDYIEVPLDPIAASGTYPDYPNDQTMVMFVKCFALNYADGDADAGFQAAAAMVQKMAERDRVSEIQESGNNDSVMLDPDMFR